jgi:dihydroorotate dehydrogenase electron transfer subunit
MNIPQPTKIQQKIQENQNTTTLLFKHPTPAQPGQFYMIWIPDCDEIPMSVSHIQHDIKGITFRTIGEATQALATKKTNDLIGIRGPYGTSYHQTGNHILYVAGGTGIAMLAPAIEQTIKNNKKATIILGAKTKKELFFINRLQQTNATLHITTDDGTQGTKGYATDITKTILQKQPTIDSIMTCGPEPMMKTLYTITRPLPFQASLERYMKCAIGICGQCTLGQGLRVCKEGPIFNEKTLQTINDFGVYKRDETGKKIYFKDL